MTRSRQTLKLLDIYLHGGYNELGHACAEIVLERHPTANVTVQERMTFALVNSIRNHPTAIELKPLIAPGVTL